MKFYTTNATGDAGLFYLGYWINFNFNFPFRVMSADIGIDAEIEMIGEGLHSEGLIIKAQVKSTQTAITSNFTEYIEIKHLEYWNRLTVPVIYFKVDLISKKIYYKIISSLDDIERTKEDNEDKWKISFDLSQDELCIKTREIWIEKFKLIEFHNIYAYFKRSEEIINSIITNVIDYDSFDEEMIKVKEAREIITKLSSLKKLYPWKFGVKLSEEYDRLSGNINITENNLRNSITQAGYN